MPTKPTRHEAQFAIELMGRREKHQRVLGNEGPLDDPTSAIGLERAADYAAELQATGQEMLEAIQAMTLDFFQVDDSGEINDDAYRSGENRLSESQQQPLTLFLWVAWIASIFGLGYLVWLLFTNPTPDTIASVGTSLILGIPLLALVILIPLCIRLRAPDPQSPSA